MDSNGNQSPAEELLVSDVEFTNRLGCRGISRYHPPLWLTVHASARSGVVLKSLAEIA